MTNAMVASSITSGTMGKLSRFLSSDSEEDELNAFNEVRQLVNDSSEGQMPVAPAPAPRDTILILDMSGIAADIASRENVSNASGESEEDEEADDGWVLPVIIVSVVVMVCAALAGVYALRVMLFKLDNLSSHGSRISQQFAPDNQHYLYFLSHKKFHSKYGKQPEAIAMHIHDVLKLKGYKGFFDTDNLRTISEAALEEAIEQSLTLIVFMHDETIQSEWCVAEWKMAEKHGIPCIVVCDIQRSDKSKLLHAVSQLGCQNLLAHQWVDYTDSLRGPAIDKLTALLTEVLQAGQQSGESKQVHANTDQQPLGGQKQGNAQPKSAPVSRQIHTSPPQQQSAPVTRQIHTSPQQLPGQVEDDDNMTAVLPST